MKAPKIMTGIAAVGAVVALALGAGNASAAIATGWTGVAGPNGSNVAFLTNSSVINAPALTAQSKIWTAFAQTVPDGEMGVKPRLFKSGALCEAVDYQYNPYPAAEYTLSTTATCGSGSYNSHGFVSVWNGTNSYIEAVTFPSNPLNWTAPSARTAKSQSVVTDADRTPGTNSTGQKYGSASTENTENLDLILAIGNDGQIGYAKASDLNSPGASNPEVAPKSTPAERTIPLYKSDGTTQTGQFTVN